MSKYNIGDKFILEITGIDRETVMEGYPKPAYRIKGMEGPFSENVLDKLDRIESNMAAGNKTNADRIQAMSIEELARRLLCPYDTTGDDEDIMPCLKIPFEDAPDNKTCIACITAWLQREVKDA